MLVRRTGVRALSKSAKQWAPAGRSNLEPKLQEGYNASRAKEQPRIDALRAAVAQLSGGHEPIVAAGAELALVYVPAADALVLSKLSLDVCAEGLAAIVKDFEGVLRTYLDADPSKQETWTNWRDVALAELCLEYLRQAQDGFITIAAAVDAIIERLDVAIASKYGSAPCVRARIETLRRMCDKEPDVDFEPTVYPEAETTTADDIRANEKTVEHRVKNGRDLQLQVLERHVLGRTNLAKRSSLVKRFANLSQGRPPQERPSSVDSLFATQKEAVVEEVVKEEVEEEVEVETVVPAAKEERTEQAATPAEAAPGPTTAAAQATLARLMGIGTSYTDEVPSVEVQGRLGGAKTTYICHDCKTQPLRSLEFIHHCSTKQHLNSVRNEPFVSAIVTALQSEAAFQWSVTRS